MDIHKNEKNELRLWAKNDIVPSDLQGLCTQAASSIVKLQERIEEFETKIEKAIILLKARNYVYLDNGFKALAILQRKDK